MKKANRFMLFIVIALLLSCGGDASSIASSNGGISGTGNGGGTQVSLAGSAYKGPFIQDSSVSVFKVDGGASSEVSNTLVLTNQGNFSFNVAPGLLSIRATGRFYDETTATYSADAVTLKALANIGTTPQKPIYLNVLTHLSHDYALELINQGYSYAQATSEAENSVTDLLKTVTGDISITQPFINMSITNTSETTPEDNTYALYISSLFTESVNDKKLEDPEYTMTTLLDTLKADVINQDSIDEATLASLQQANGRLDAAAIQQNLEAVLIGATIAPIDNVIEEVSPGLAPPSNLTTYSDTVNSKQRFCFDMTAICSDPAHKAEIIVPSGYSYEFQFDNNGDFSSPEISTAWGRNFYEINFSSLSSGTWYFRVRRIHDDGQLSVWESVDFQLP